jgi:hypothetical protein
LARAILSYGPSSVKRMRLADEPRGEPTPQRWLAAEVRPTDAANGKRRDDRTRCGPTAARAHLDHRRVGPPRHPAKRQDWKAQAVHPPEHRKDIERSDCGRLLQRRANVNQSCFDAVLEGAFASTDHVRGAVLPLAREPVPWCLLIPHACRSARVTGIFALRFSSFSRRSSPRSGTLPHFARKASNPETPKPPEIRGF